VNGYDEFPGTGAGIYCIQASMLLEENEVAKNFAVAGSASVVWALECDVEIRRNLVRGNMGGGLALVFCKGTVSGNIIDENTGTLGSGVACTSNDVPISFVNNTVVRNFGVGGGMRFTDAAATVTNCILWGNVPDRRQIVVTGRGLRPVVVSHSMIQFGEVIGGGWEDGGGNILDGAPRFANFDEGDYHLRLGSPCVDAGDNASVVSMHDMDRHPRIVEGDGDEVAVVDMGADEMLAEIAVRFGGVDAARGSVRRVLRVNGSSGNRDRVVRLRVRDPITVEMLAPPAGPEPARFACYAWRGAPDRATLTRQPFGLGIMGFPTFLAGGPDNLPIRVWNTPRTCSASGQAGLPLPAGALDSR